MQWDIKEQDIQKKGRSNVVQRLKEAVFAYSRIITCLRQKTDEAREERPVRDGAGAPVLNHSQQLNLFK